ncbi:putative RNA-binding protein 48 [Paratrimastix pyriformis]|uniref:RNA-binding protein 48 n=1 Tax=Paratrimastix pyriformis TaxID=342808 RepID=A0ABQ8USR5_9EUKA|nr:putative RNA-binding protein 48 [Paratrimastix pyriformis]
MSRRRDSGEEGEKAVVYTVNEESRYITVRNVTQVAKEEDLIPLFSVFGEIDETRLLENEPTEDFTSVYWIKFQDIDSARAAKHQMDQYSLFGVQISVKYAPEFETVADTWAKITQHGARVLAGLSWPFDWLPDFQMLFVGVALEAVAQHARSQQGQGKALPALPPRPSAPPGLPIPDLPPLGFLGPHPASGPLWWSSAIVGPHPRPAALPTSSHQPTLGEGPGSFVAPVPAPAPNLGPTTCGGADDTTTEAGDRVGQGAEDATRAAIRARLLGKHPRAGRPEGEDQADPLAVCAGVSAAPLPPSDPTDPLAWCSGSAAGGRALVRSRGASSTAMTRTEAGRADQPRGPRIPLPPVLGPPRRARGGGGRGRRGDARLAHPRPRIELAAPGPPSVTRR